jgi:hypothetical protein
MGFGVWLVGAADQPHPKSLFSAALAWLFMQGAAGVRLRFSQSQQLCENPAQALEINCLDVVS